MNDTPSVTDSPANAGFFVRELACKALESEYDSATTGPSLSIRSHDLDESGNKIAPGQRCRLIQGDNQIILDRALLSIIKQHLDNDCSA